MKGTPSFQGDFPEYNISIYVYKLCLAAKEGKKWDALFWFFFLKLDDYVSTLGHVIVKFKNNRNQ